MQGSFSWLILNEIDVVENFCNLKIIDWHPGIFWPEKQIR
jgi:hypothetical protein